MAECLRCGRCCYFYAGNSNKLKKCKYLLKTGDNKTYCRIYRLREAMKWKPFKVYQDKYGEVYCMSRAEQKATIEGCPLNPL